MSQIPNENDDNRSVAASDFVQLEQPDEVPDQEAQQQEQQEGESQFGLNQSLDWTSLNTESTPNNDENGLKEMKWMMANLQAQIQTLQFNVKNLELEAKIRSLEENAEHKANYQALEAKFAQMLSTQNEQHRREMDAKMEQLQTEFSKMLAEQQKQLMVQFQAQFHSLEQKQKGAEQRAQMGTNEIKILANPKGIVWDQAKTKATISECGLKAAGSIFGWVFAIATKGYAISGEHCRKDNFQFPGTIVFYYEVTTSWFGYSSIGYTDGSKPAGYVGYSPSCVSVGGSPNSYGIDGYDCGAAAKEYSCWLSGKKQKMENPFRAIAGGDVVGSGLLLNSKNELAVFFTVNGILLGKQTPINPSVDLLYPTVSIFRASMEANFGDNLVAKPFKFDIGKCPGLVFE